MGTLDRSDTTLTELKLAVAAFERLPSEPQEAAAELRRFVQRGPRGAAVPRKHPRTVASALRRRARSRPNVVGVISPARRWRATAIARTLVVCTGGLPHFLSLSCASLPGSRLGESLFSHAYSLLAARC
jgi:hypothetical protein